MRYSCEGLSTMFTVSLNRFRQTPESSWPKQSCTYVNLKVCCCCCKILAIIWQGRVVTNFQFVKTTLSVKYNQSWYVGIYSLSWKWHICDLTLWYTVLHFCKKIFINYYNLSIAHLFIHSFNIYLVTTTHALHCFRS